MVFAGLGIFQEHKLGENVFAKWTDCRMYPATIVAINTSGQLERCWSRVYCYCQCFDASLNIEWAWQCVSNKSLSVPGTYDVVFYDGFKKTVQAINVRNMPEEVQTEVIKMLKSGR